MFFSYISLLLMPAAFFLSFFVGLLTHLSSASFLTISLFPEALCSYAASFCGVSLRLKLSLHTLVNGFFDLPLSMPFSQFSFFPSHWGRFILHCPLSFIRLLLTASSFWRIYSHPSFSDVALPLTQRREFAKRGV